MSFETAGRALDRELRKLKTYLNKQAKPATRRDMARVLRQASRRLNKLAKSLETPER
jgi:hypothetical protein